MLDRATTTRPLSHWPVLGVVALGSLVVIWAVSVPGASVWLGAFGVLALMLGFLLWAIRLRMCHRSGRVTRSAVIVPVIALLLAGLVVTDLPLKARWSLSRPAFEAVVADLRPPVDDGPVVVPQQIGSYRILGAFAIRDGLVFQEASGNFFETAGFAYLPEGATALRASDNTPTPDLESLGGPWYRWTLPA